MNITAAMYEEDEMFLGSPELVTWYVYVRSPVICCTIALNVAVGLSIRWPA